MSMRLPDWLFRPLDRVVTAQRRLRRAESNERLSRADDALRAYYAKHWHDAGTCGGSVAGCPYVPCVPRAKEGVR